MTALASTAAVLAMPAMAVAPGWADWLQFFAQFVTLSLFAVGGAVTVAADLNRRLVVEHPWLTDAQFTASIALGQAAPGPNVLFIGLVGWHAGLNVAGYPTAVLGLLLALLGILLPSTVLTLSATRWAHRHREDRAVRAFKAGMAPLVIGLMVATAALLDLSVGPVREHPVVWALTTVTALTLWFTRVHLLWLLAAGAVLGALGWV